MVEGFQKGEEANKGTTMNFAALDVETANEDLASICQIGLAEYEDTALVREWKSYVDPEDDFSGLNISIHGIDESVVAGSPTFASLWDSLNAALAGRVVCCHTSFDRASIRRACAKYRLNEPACVWLDTARVARRAWPQFAHGGYGIKNLAEFLKYSFAHHDALEDAKASARILLAAIEATGLDLDGWLKRTEQPLDLSVVPAGAISLEGNPEGALFGEVVVFTGTLGLTRREAADMAAQSGCTIRPDVTKNTTILVVGNQDIKRLAGH